VASGGSSPTCGWLTSVPGNPTSANPQTAQKTARRGVNSDKPRKWSEVNDRLNRTSISRRTLNRTVEAAETNKEIANQLSLSVYTVEAHRSRLMEKLNLHSTGGLVRFEIRNGFIS
jgi:DNA-binding NarL/FixJ family response regulator